MAISIQQHINSIVPCMQLAMMYLFFQLIKSKQAQIVDSNTINIKTMAQEIMMYNFDESKNSNNETV